MAEAPRLLMTVEIILSPAIVEEINQLWTLFPGFMNFQFLILLLHLFVYCCQFARVMLRGTLTLDHQWT